MFRKMLSYFTLSLLLFLSTSSGNSAFGAAQSAPQGLNPGPDIITGAIGLAGDLEQFGRSGGQVGLGVSTTACNAGNVVVNFHALPATNHPVIMHNLYRMSGGSANDERFEQIGQSWVKHAFGADQANACFICHTGGDFTHLGAGCSDTYANFQNADQEGLGSRALVNPFTGVFQSNANDHTGHNHTSTSHMIVVETNDLNITLNPGATYYAEVQYISSDEYAWCQTHSGQCNMYNNASYAGYSVFGTNKFTFTPTGSSVRMSGAVHAWPGATINPIEPEPGVDGRAFIAYKVTGPVAGVWHYEYALYNENLDRGIQSFSLPLGCGITVNNLGFHAPLNSPGFPNDGTQGGAGFSNTAWTSNQTFDTLSWNTETVAQNQNANAIRWGTLYNFRFDSDRPPHATNATIGFFKTGGPVTVAIQGPDACNAAPTPTAAPPPPPGTAQALNLSTRMRVETETNVGIGGFIVTGTAPKHLLLRGMGPSLILAGVPDVLFDPVLELHGPAAFAAITNDNWRDDPGQEAAIQATGIAPNNYLESAIDATLNPGAYTAVVRGKNNTLGVGLVEVYDLNPEVSAKLANISTRALVSTGNDNVIAGFILGRHSGSDRIVVRGIGPSLTALGVSDALADPTLELRDVNGALLASNNDWHDNAAQAAQLTTDGLAPTSNLESGIATTLAPGLYTALLAGLNNGIGVGLVEVYDLGTP